jgi:hypothetical protein
MPVRASVPLTDKILLRKRSIIETVNDQLKNISQIEHPRHRRVANFMVNLIAGLTAYTYQPKKPSLQFIPTEEKPIESTRKSRPGLNKTHVRIKLFV